MAAQSTEKNSRGLNHNAFLRGMEDIQIHMMGGDKALSKYRAAMRQKTTGHEMSK